MLNSLFMAFSLYSQIPVPQVPWDEKAMRYCICFLPLVGAVIGAAQALLFVGLTLLSPGPVFCGALLTALPVLLSGGIHLDGFLDTCDAIHSYRGKEDRLSILQDPHVGAFAVTGGILYFVLDLGIWTEAASGADAHGTGVLCLGFVLSRALSAFAALTFPKAKKDGMLRRETDPAAPVKETAAAVMAAAALLTCAAMVWMAPLCGLAASLAALAVLLYYRRMSEKQFGGITGDLAGWFTQVCELIVGIAVVLCMHIH